MADTIKVKRGLKANMPKLGDYELGYATDTKELYIGTAGGNVRLCGGGDIAEINKNTDEIKTRLDALEQLDE